jgi:ATPase subunit of ABC transporter with duplicated ATPase domains
MIFLVWAFVVCGVNGWIPSSAPRFSSRSTPSGADGTDPFLREARFRKRPPPEAVADGSRGDARGAALLLEGVTVFRGPAEVLSNISWRVEPRQKWAVVGANGAGKTTLLKAVVGEIAHGGRITVGSKQEVGYLQQTAVAGSNLTIYEEARSAMTAIQEAREAMERAEESGDLQALERASAKFEAAGGYQQESKVSNVMTGLGFDPTTVKRSRCNELSGGWQMRVAFARQLLSDPTLSLLDEPGNHLDAAAKKWLAKYLADYDGEASLILVTHDVELLKSMDHIAEVVPGTGDVGGSLQIYKSCTYEQYLELKQQRATAAVAEYERNADKAARLQAFVDRFGASATKASQAQSRVKQIEKMLREGLLDAPLQSIVAQRFKPSMVLPDPPRAIGEVFLSLGDADVGWTGELLRNVKLEVTKGMKLLIRGPNGCGKSTILFALRGMQPPLLDDAARRTNPSLRLGMFTQDLAQELDTSARAVDLVMAYAREGMDGDISVSEQEARSVMGRLGLQGDKPLRKVGDLSGGEKARVALAMFALKPSNVYLLDEPSNHLDAECVEALSDALNEWSDVDDKNLAGALVVVSHDRNFCEKLQFTHVATVSDEGTLTLEQRGAVDSDWVVGGLSSGRRTSVVVEPTNGEVVSIHPEAYTKLRKRAHNAPKRIAKLEQMIQDMEEQMAALDEEMLSIGSDVGTLIDLNKEKETLASKVEACMEEWTELEEILAQVQHT